MIKDGILHFFIVLYVHFDIKRKIYYSRSTQITVVHKCITIWVQSRIPNWTHTHTQTHTPPNRNPKSHFHRIWNIHLVILSEGLLNSLTNSCKMSILVHKISNVINSRGNAVGWHFNFNNWEESLGLKKKSLDLKKFPKKIQKLTISSVCQTSNFVALFLDWT